MKLDERAFEEQAVVFPSGRAILFPRPPTEAALRHLARMPGRWSLAFIWIGNNSPSTCPALRGRALLNITTLSLHGDMNVDAWLKEIARPDSSFGALTGLDIGGTGVTDAGVRELVRPDCALRSLVSLELYNTAVTDAAMRELARADSGLRTLKSVHVGGTRTTDEGLATLRKDRPGLFVGR